MEAPGNTDNRISPSASGKWLVNWRGKVVYTEEGAVREFSTEAKAKEYVDKCDREGRLVE